MHLDPIFSHFIDFYVPGFCRVNNIEAIGEEGAVRREAALDL